MSGIFTSVRRGRSAVIGQSRWPTQHGPSWPVRWHMPFAIVRKRLSCVAASRGIWGEGSCGCGLAHIAAVIRICRENKADDGLENTGGGGNATGCDRRTRPVHGLAVLGRAQPVPLFDGNRLPRPDVLVAGGVAGPSSTGAGVLEERQLSRRMSSRQPFQ